MDVSAESLVTLTAVLREGTFEAAAASLHVTPSAVSQRIKALEQSVGRVLVRRVKPVTATPDGEVLARLGEQWSLLVAEAQGELTGIAHEPDVDPRMLPRVTIPIACNADSLATWFLPVVAEFHSEHPVSIDLHRDDESVTTAMLRAGDVVGAVTSEPIVVRGCQTVELGSLRYFPVASPEFIERWLPNGVRARDMQYAPMVMFDRKDHLQIKALKHLVAEPISPPVNYIPSASEYRRAIQAGIGWGAVPEVEIDDEQIGRRLVPLTKRPVDVPLYWQHWKLRSPLVSGLTDLVVEHARRSLVPPRRGLAPVPSGGR
ncbi:transcriptional regulator, LysR family [Gordonia malaquae]|uniref:Putative LysR family transcriptional regulator n=1 Tax=Gordonia malaquae NBRC 108250 TaxID=1223542 RepID=M3VH46_GORML|nr:LysR family transcriptional regulator ArgP [Gordonia malaquae]GAC81634.1 putative LysR family transcriptional regulator [Gordonia malaquae NBRC 108250]SEE28543.1 transcriptional regulator, LysR family [Gordonia malaquae]